jgi:hypothetical protein
MTWKSILGPAKSEATLEVFAVRGRHYAETSDAYLEIIREFANRAAELAREGGNSIGAGQKIDDVQFVYGSCTGRGQWETQGEQPGDGVILCLKYAEKYQTDNSRLFLVLQDGNTARVGSSRAACGG